MSTGVQDVEVDLVVVGAGLAGLCAARRATELGHRVAVLERGQDADYPCNTRISGGVMVVGGRPATTAGEELAAALARSTFGACDSELGGLLARRSGAVVAWLEAHGAGFAAVEFHAGLTFTEVLSPTGLTSTGVDWKGKGPDLLLRRLAAGVVADGGSLRLGHEATSLLRSGDAVVGVEAVCAGQPVRLSAAAVLLADGGFQGDRDLVAEHVAPNPASVLLRAEGSGRGWALRAAKDAGARLVNLDCFYGHLVSADALHDDRLWPYPVLDPLLDAGILVGRDGRRFTDEGLGGVDVANNLARLSDPFAYVVLDDLAWRGPAAASLHPPSANPWLVDAGGTVHEATTIEGLEHAAGLPAGALQSTISEVHELGTSSGLSGAVPRSGGGGSGMYAGSIAHPPVSIRQPPFRAIPTVPGISFTMGGPLVDASARVLDSMDRPIVGLYAAGSCCGGFEGGPVVGYAGGLMRAAITGLAAAEHVHLSLLADHRS